MKRTWKFWQLALATVVITLQAMALQAESVKVGDTAPALELPLLAEPGEALSLQALRGKVVYLDFWASWCGPCRLSFPQLEVLRQELGPRGFEVVAINVDEFEEDAIQFSKDVPVSYPLLRDEAAATPALYGILGMPTGFLLDPEGIVRLVHQGYRRSDGDKLRAEIVELLESSQ